MRKHFVLNLFLLLPVLANGQDSLKTTTLREVVVSATRTEQPIIEIPRSVTVIPEAVIRNAVYQSLGDLLNAESGLYVVGANQTPGMNQNVFMRGTNSNQVAVLIDGVRVTDPSSPNSAIDLSEISLANIERIEIIRGSHSTVFGGAAIGGVINLITKKNAPSGFHGGISWQGGHFGKHAWSSAESATLSYTTEIGLYLTGSVFQQDVNGLNATDSGNDLSFSVDDDDFQKTDATIKSGFKNDRWDLNVSFKNGHQYTEVDNGAYLDDDNYYLLFDRKLLQFQAAYKVSPVFRISALGSLSGSERYYENDSSRVSDTTWDKAYSSGTYFGNLQTHEIQLNYDRQKWQAVFGAGFYREKMFFDSYFFYNDPSFPIESVTNYDSIDSHTHTGYIFSQARYGIGKFRLSAGGRLSHHTLAGNFLTFEVSPSFTFQDLLVYGSLSTGFNAPSLYQLFDPSRSFTAHTARGNPNLDPEQSVSLEVGIKKEFREGSYVTFSAYDTRVRNAIEYVYLWNGATPRDEIAFEDDRGDTYINVGKQLVRGVEMDAFARISDRLSLNGNVSFLFAKVKADPADLDPVLTGGHHVQLYNLGTFLNAEVEEKDVVRRPNTTAFARLRYRIADGIVASTAYRYTGKRFDAGYDGSLGPYGALGRIEIDAYHLADAGLDWQAAKNLAVAARVENLLNADYREVAGFQTRGRSVYLKLIAHW
jgi:vitamin B12 transporter